MCMFKGKPKEIFVPENEPLIGIKGWGGWRGNGYIVPEGLFNYDKPIGGKATTLYQYWGRWRKRPASLPSWRLPILGPEPPAPHFDLRNGKLTGFQAWKPKRVRKDPLKHILPPFVQYVGFTALWGRVLEFKDGWAAEYAEPCGMFGPIHEP